MNKVPDKILREIPSHHSVVWWGRRAVFEIVKEITLSIFYLYVGLGLAYSISYELIEYDRIYWIFWLIAAVIIINLAKIGPLEYLGWANDIYVVTHDQKAGGGRIYHFTGWPYQAAVYGTIGGHVILKNANLSWLERNFYGVWGKVTGEKMVSLQLKVREIVDRPLIDGNRISPALEYFINSIEGQPPPGPTNEPPALNWSNLQQLGPLVAAGLLDQKTAQGAVRAIVERGIHG